jgi:hypothetical protein
VIIFLTKTNHFAEKAGLVDKIWGRNDGLAKSDIRVFDPYLKRQSIDPKIKNMIKSIQKLKNGHFDAKYLNHQFDPNVKNGH